jgi:hypothetical protein
MTANYTAPATVPTGGSVTVTATSVADPAQSASVLVTIVPAATSGAIAVSITPASFYAQPTGAARTVPLTAAVANDPANAGVTWTVTCGGAGACGTLTPGTNTNDVIAASYQAPSAVPGGGTVTITATSVTNPSVFAIATATITTSAVTTVKFATAPPASLAEGGTATLAATETPAGQTINWTATCGTAGGCGSFSANATASGGSTIYTAPGAIPAGHAVTITATSAAAISNSANAVTTIVTPAPAIAFVQQPPSTLTTLSQASVSAAVTNDLAPGGVTWSVSCSATVAGGCGSIQPYKTANGVTATYTAPPLVPGGTVSVIATSTSFPTLQVSSTPITIAPSTALSVSFIPAVPSQLPSYSVVNLDAAVSGDATNAGVDWQVCASGCGFFTTVAAVPAIPATPTTPYVPAVPAVTATSVSAWPNGSPISYTAPLATSQGQTVAVNASAHANHSVATSANIAITDGVTGPSINGTVQAGTQPVVGASVGLYAAGTAGYGSAATLLFAPGGSSYGTTDSAGNFTLPAGYICPKASSEVYLVATGGRAGTNAANPNLSLMTALGPCSNLSSGKVYINEVTTIGSAWPLAPFATNNPITGAEGYLNIGTSITNTTGLANAFAAVNNLVNIATGQARFTVPAGNGAVPYAEINTLADILNTCTASAGGAYDDGSACGTLFYESAPLGLGGTYTATAPTDTVQAALNLAQHPFGGSSDFGYNNKIANLYGLVTPGSPFQPILASTPNDFSISMNFTAAGGLTGTSGADHFALDAAGDLWITECGANPVVVEWNNLGAAASAGGFSIGGTSAACPLAIDASGNIWISSSNGLTELYGDGSLAENSPFANGGHGLGIAIDSLSNLWITNGTGVLKFNDAGTELSPTAGYLNAGVSNTGSITIDGSNNVWVSQFTASTLSVADIYDSSGVLDVNLALPGTYNTAQIAADGSGSVWVPAGIGTGPGLCKVPAYGGLGSVFTPTCFGGGSAANYGQTTSITSAYSPAGAAVDGSGAVWFGNLGGQGVTPPVQPNVTEIVPGGLSISGSEFAEFVSSSLSAGPLQVAIDGSGNVWVLLANNTITEYVGVATPAITPLALAVKNNKIGAKP